MESTSPIVQSNAGQSPLASGNRFNCFWMGTKQVDDSTAIEWLSHGGDGAYRGRHRPSATGYGHPG